MMSLFIPEYLHFNLQSTLNKNAVVSLTKNVGLTLFIVGLYSKLLVIDPTALNLSGLKIQCQFVRPEGIEPFEDILILKKRSVLWNALPVLGVKL